MLIIWKEHKTLDSYQYFCSNEGIRCWINVSEVYLTTSKQHAKKKKKKYVNTNSPLYLIFFPSASYPNTFLSMKHPRYQRNKLAKGICCDEFVKAWSEAEVCLLFDNRFRTCSVIIPVLTGSVVFTSWEMCTQLKDLDKASVFLSSVYFKQILSVLIKKELKGIQCTTNDSHVDGHKSQAPGRSLLTIWNCPNRNKDRSFFILLCSRVKLSVPCSPEQPFLTHWCYTFQRPQILSRRLHGQRHLFSNPLNV